jgi:DNA-binding CsgD family transcriptional regulator
VLRKRAAVEALSAARDLFEQLEAQEWVGRTTRELDRVGLRARPEELTATERVIAELAAAGKTNREIAQTAFVSPKTVEANLARVYRKLGIRTRAELGAHMARERGGVQGQT